MSAWNFNGPTLTEDAVINRAPGMKLPLIIRPHQGMGDHILCNGLYRCLADEWRVTVCCLDERSLLQNVRHMLSDRTDISVLGFADEGIIERYCCEAQDAAVLRLGYVSPPFDRWHFDEEFYRQANVPFEWRWDGFILPWVAQLPVQSGEYCFVHDKPGREIEGVPFPHIIVRPQLGIGIFSHRELLEHATEIHCISSSFAAFADCYDLTGKKLFFYAKGIEVPKHRNKWEYK